MVQTYNNSISNINENSEGKKIKNIINFDLTCLKTCNWRFHTQVPTNLLSAGLQIISGNRGNSEIVISQRKHTL